MLDKSTFLKDNKIMVNKSEIYSNFFKENQTFPRNFLDVYTCEKDGSSYLILCNYNNSKTISEQAFEKIKKQSEQKDVYKAFYEYFDGQEDVLQLIGNYFIETQNINPSVEELANYINKAIPTPKDGKTKIERANTIIALKIDEKGKITNNLAFNMSFNIETIKSIRETKNRAFIKNAESFERGKGIYKEILTKFLPQILSKNKIPVIVLQASAFDSDSNEKTSQKNLEQFYKSVGFTRAYENIEEDTNFIRESDFTEGLPVYYKYVSAEKMYSEQVF